MFKGGIAWERSERAVSIATSARCYTLAQSYQVQRGVVGPTTGTRDLDADKWHGELRSEVIQVDSSTNVFE